MNFISKVFKRYSVTDVFLLFLKFMVGYPIHWISYLCPRNKHKWVLGHKMGFSDNSKYLYIFLTENTDCRAIWIAHKKKSYYELKEKNISVCYKYSLKGFYHLMTAYYYVTTSSPRHVCYWTSGGAYKINLWHGVGLKAIGKTSASLKDGSLLSKLFMFYSYEKIDLFLSTSPLMNEHFSKSLNINMDSIFEGIYPRCKFLMENRDYHLNFVKKYEPIYMQELIDRTKKYEKTYIYMPTWRLMYGDKFLNAAFPDMAKLNEALKKSDSLLILKLHSSISYNTEDMKAYSNILYINKSVDIYPLLPFTDVLITDYSSIYYDYILMEGKGCILYDFDYDNYVKKEYSFIRDYKSYTPGVHVGNFDDLVNIIFNNEACVVEKRDWILNLFWGDYKNKNLFSLYDRIKSN